MQRLNGNSVRLGKSYDILVVKENHMKWCMREQFCLKSQVEQTVRLACDEKKEKIRMLLLYSWHLSESQPAVSQRNSHNYLLGAANLYRSV